jgi:hypothetical protein
LQRQRACVYRSSDYIGYGVIDHGSVSAADAYRRRTDGEFERILVG